MAEATNEKFTVRCVVTRGDIDCGMNLACQIISTIVGVSSALGIVLVAPFENSVTGPDRDKMKALINNVVYGRVVSGMCVTIVFGNVYYAWMAVRMMKKERRHDVACLPYGVNTPAAFAFIFNVVAKAARAAEAKGMSYEDGILYAWRVGCVANLIAGTIGILCGFLGPQIVKAAPKASLLIALAGIGFTWLGINQVIICLQAGYAGLLPLGVALVCFFTSVKTDPIPAAMIVMFVGGLVGWLSCQGWPDGKELKDGGTADAVRHAFAAFGFYMPSLMDSNAFAAIPEVIRENISVILPVSFTGAVATLLSVYASHDAGDVYSIRESMVVDGLATVVAALFGSPFGTCVFLGHPQFKAQGGRISYSFITCIIFCLLASTGLFAAVNAFVPPYAIAPIVLFVGLAINQDAFSCTPTHQYPAAILGLFPPFADWILSQWPSGSKPPPQLAALAHGALLVGIIWTALSVELIERRFKRACIWSLIASTLSSIGLIHQDKVDLALNTFMGEPGAFGTSSCSFSIGYGFMAIAFGLLAVMQQMGSSRVPPASHDEDGQALPDEVGRTMSKTRTRTAINLATFSAGEPFNSDRETDDSSEMTGTSDFDSADSVNA